MDSVDTAYNMDMIVLAIASLVLRPEPGLDVVRRLILTVKPGQERPNVKKWGESYVAGDGRVFLRVREGVSWKLAATRLAGVANRIVAVPPRLSGMARNQAELDSARKKVYLARKEYALLAGVAGLKAPPLPKAPRGIGGQQTRLEWSEPRSWKAPSRGPKPAAVALPEVWVNAGPYNLQVASQYGSGVSPINGRINDAAYDFGNTQRIFAAAGRGGVWRSENGGIDWAPLSDSWASMATNVVKTNPGLPNRVYVGMGDYPTNYGLAMGLMVSQDNGATWTQRGADQFASTLIADIAVSPTTAPKLFVASGGGTGGTNALYVSPDEGVTWQTAIPTPTRWTDLEISDLIDGKRYIYAAGTLGGTSVVLYRSDDDGQSFSSMSVPEAIDGDRPYISSSKIRPDIVYLHYNRSQRVWKNTGRAGTWVEITGDLIEDSGSNWAQEDFNYGITCVKRVAGLATVDAVFVQNTDTYVTDAASPDGTASNIWKSFCNGYTGDDLTHVDHHGIIPHPTDPFQLLFVNDGGIYRCFYEATPNNGVFTPLSKNLVAALVSRISVPFVPANGILAGMQDNGMGYVGGDFTNWGNVVAGDLGHTAINPSFPANMYVMPPNFGVGNDPEDPPGYLIETTDDWQTQQQRPVDTFGDKRRSSPPIAIDPSQSRFVYVATNYLYRYDLLTQTWESKLGNQVLDSLEHVRHLAVAPSNSNRIYTVGKSGEVYMSPDRGVSWKEIGGALSPLPNGTLSHISVDPTDEKRVLVSREEGDNSSKLYECLDTTAADPVWVSRHGINGGSILPKDPIIAIARHPVRPSTAWFVASDSGVYMTQNGGADWSDLTPDGTFPNVPVTDIKIQESTSRIFVSTYGRGVWHRSLPRAPRSTGRGR